MLLLIDIGNSNIKACLYDSEVKDIVRLKTGAVTEYPDRVLKMFDGFNKIHGADKPEGSVISSVVPDITQLFVDALRKTFNIDPVVVDQRAETGLKLMVKDPEGVGADRLANAAAANKFYKGNKIIVDLGTATTFCVVTDEGIFKGGAIMPGIDVSAKALADNTAKLPKIVVRAPDKILGDVTTDAILSGIIIGHAGAIERIIEDIAKETGMDYTVLMTGGRADIIAPFVRSIKHVDHDLTFKGLKAIYDLNS